MNILRKKILEVGIYRTGRVVTYKQYDDNGYADVGLSKVKFIDVSGTKYSFLEATSNTDPAKTNGKTKNIVFSSVNNAATNGAVCKITDGFRKMNRNFAIFCRM